MVSHPTSGSCAPALERSPSQLLVAPSEHKLPFHLNWVVQSPPAPLTPPLLLFQAVRTGYLCAHRGPKKASVRSAGS